MKSITSIVLILVAIGGFFFYVDPEYKKVKALQVEKAENAKILEIANKLKTKKTDLENKFNQISQVEKTQLEKLLPDTVDNVRLIIDINKIAEEKGLTVRNISIQSNDTDSSQAKQATSKKSNFDGVLQDGTVKYVDTSKVGVLSFSFSVSAKYEVFLDFLQELEESLRLLDIRNIQISRGAESVFYDYTVTFDTYWLK